MVSKTTFGSALKHHRVGLGATQTKLAEAVSAQLSEGVSVNQSFISAWETDRQVPSVQVVNILNKILNADLNPYIDSPEDAGGSEFSPDDYFESADKRLQNIKYQCDLFFISPRRLPILGNQRQQIAETWKKNYQKGASYSAIWFVEHIDDSFLDVASQLLSIAEDIRRNQLHVGREADVPFFTNYLTSLYPEELVRRKYAKNLQDYYDLEAGLELHGVLDHIRVEKPCFMALQSDVLNGFQKYVQGFCTLLLYKPRSFMDLAFSSLCLDSVQYHDSPESGVFFHWFDDDTSKVLSSTVKEFLLTVKLKDSQ